MRPHRLSETPDSWVLLAVLLCGDHGGTLSDLVSTGDYANHAVFPFQRLRDGLYHLQRAGLVTCRNGRYRGSIRAARFWRSAQEKERRLLKAWDLLERWLVEQDLPAVVTGVRRITTVKYRGAVKQYLDQP